MFMGKLPDRDRPRVRIRPAPQIPTVGMAGLGGFSLKSIVKALSPQAVAAKVVAVNKSAMETAKAGLHPGSLKNPSSTFKKALEKSNPLAKIFGDTPQKRAARFGKTMAFRTKAIGPVGRGVEKVLNKVSVSKALDILGKNQVNLRNRGLFGPDKITRWLSPAGYLHRPGGVLHPDKVTIDDATQEPMIEPGVQQDAIDAYAIQQQSGAVMNQPVAGENFSVQEQDYDAAVAQPQDPYVPDASAGEDTPLPLDEFADDAPPVKKTNPLWYAAAAFAVKVLFFS